MFNMFTRDDYIILLVALPILPFTLYEIFVFDFIHEQVGIFNIFGIRKQSFICYAKHVSLESFLFENLSKEINNF